MIQDDCSTDGTFAVAEKYARQYPERIRAVRRNAPSGSAQNNFFSMLRLSDSEYTMFCDDDDVWLPDKLLRTSSAMKQLEASNGPDKPLLVHTDLGVMDCRLNLIAPSMIRRQKLDPNRRRLNQMLPQNNVTGCTVMANRCLLRLATRQGLPQHAVMHDWWFALISSALGKIGFVPQATTLYRQHRDNRVGAKNAGDILYNMKRLVNGAEARRSLEASLGQVEEFLDRFGPLLGEDQKRLLRDFVSIPSLGKWKRLAVIRENGFWDSGLFRKLGQIWFV